VSSILKALKKLEEEKSLRKDDKEINVTREILKPPAERRGIVKWLWVFSIIAVAVIVIQSAALFRKSATTDEARSRLIPVMSRLSSSVSAPPPAASTLPREPEVKKVAIPSHSPIPAPRQDSSSPAVSSPGKESRPLIELPNAPVFPVELPKTTIPPKSEPPHRTSPPSDVTLTLSGIAWHKDSSDRLAIINGQPAATGAVVNGAVVEEILPDKVRMNLSGKTFDLVLGGQTKTN
jgi:general secretion pathway protein B